MENRGIGESNALSPVLPFPSPPQVRFRRPSPCPSPHWRERRTRWGEGKFRRSLAPVSGERDEVRGIPLGTFKVGLVTDQEIETFGTIQLMLFD